MPRDPKKLLYDMKQAVDRILRYVKGRTFDDFVADDYFRSAVERQFEIIGEAMVRLRKIGPEAAARISNQNKISGFRNALIHNYDGIDHVISWNVVVQHLPILQTELELLLSE
jgi:uncharacterized protein with HEPN domain